MHFDSFHVIGIRMRTTNENGQAANDFPRIWEKFFSENILQKIPNKFGDTVYCVYNEYESDYTKPYTVTIGCKVSKTDQVPPGMALAHIPAGKFEKFTAKGDVFKGAIYETWKKIWQAKIDRKYSADFELYDDRAKDPTNSTVDIFISVK